MSQQRWDYLFLVNMALVVTFATYHGKDEDVSLSNAGNVLSESLGAKGLYVWAIALFASGQSSTMTGTLAGQYIMSVSSRANVLNDTSLGFCKN